MSSAAYCGSRAGVNSGAAREAGRDTGARNLGDRVTLVHKTDPLRTMPRYRPDVRLTPRYDGPPVLRIDVAMSDPSVPLLRQRRRLGQMLGNLDDDQWGATTRCEGWTVRDVVAHLVTTNRFWAASVTAGLAGEPSRFLVTFDPVASPAALVDAGRGTRWPEVFDAYCGSVEALATVVERVAGDAWDRLAEAPPGHVTLRAVALHALWDAWIHERDITIPLGLPVRLEKDEVLGCLFYSAALGPSLSASRGCLREGSLTITATEPEAVFTVECGPIIVVRDGMPAKGPNIAGDAVALIEGLSFRAPLEHGLATEDMWLLGDLGKVFDQP